MNRHHLAGALFVVSLTTMPAASGQHGHTDPGPGAISGAELVEFMNGLARASGNRFGLDDGATLAAHIDALRLDLESRAALQDGDWNSAWGIEVTTTEPAPDACDSVESVTTTSHSGVEFEGTLCRLGGAVDGLSFETRDLVLQAPLDGQTVYFRGISTMEATDPGLLAEGGDILAAGIEAVIADIHFTPGGQPDVDNGVFQWISLLDDLSSQTDAYIRFHDTNALADALNESAAALDAASDLAGATWGVSFAINASQTVTTGNNADPHQDGTTPEQGADVCHDLGPIELPDPTGQVYTWQQCSTSPTGDPGATGFALRMWRETGQDNARGSVDFAVGTSTDTAAFRDTLSGYALAMLHMMASAAQVEPAATGATAE